MNKMKKYLFLSLVLPLLSFVGVHKFYLSVSEINYSEKDQAVRMIARVFIDDLEALLQERYAVKGNLATEEEAEMANFYLEKYLRLKLELKVDEVPLDYKILGRKTDGDMFVFYIEAPVADFETAQSFSVQNEILMDLYEEQQNVVHLTFKGRKKSFILLRERPKAVLNF